MSETPLDAAAYYRWSLSPEDRARLPRYDKLVDALADSEIACHLLVEARPGQRNPMLVLAALHYSALAGDEVLAPLYGAITETAPDAFARRVVERLEARPDLVRAQLHRATQTNEPGRSAIIRAVLRELRARGVLQVHLIDVGTSMGLNLYPDFYRVNVDDPSDVAALLMEDLHGTAQSGPLPVIHQRIGIDLNPLDPENPDHVLWLRACLWPEEPQRSERFLAVLAEMKSWPRATRLQGAANDLIDGAMARCAVPATPVIFHSWVAAYFSMDQQTQWRELVMRHVGERAVWVYCEHPGGVKGLEPPSSDFDSPRPGGTQIVVAETGEEPVSWGWAHPHGRWIAMTPGALR